MDYFLRWRRRIPPPSCLLGRAAASLIGGAVPRKGELAFRWQGGRSPPTRMDVVPLSEIVGGNGGKPCRNFKDAACGAANRVPGGVHVGKKDGIGKQRKLTGGKQQVKSFP